MEARLYQEERETDETASSLYGEPGETREHLHH